jgi:hypothetical protein
MNEQQAMRLASNEAMFRAVNEKIAGLNEAFDPLADDGTFICECSSLDCIEQVEITLAEYAAVRRNPRWFLVAPSEGHVVVGIERIVERAQGYFVVEKLDAAAEVVEQLARQ